MEKEFIPYEEALALKELGFNCDCLRGWSDEKQIWYHPDSEITLDNPTFSQAFRWFREKYNYLSYVNYINGNFRYNYNYIGGALILYMEDYNTHEEAELACLKKLIEIAQKSL
jgi:hypothetical protein